MTLWQRLKDWWKGEFVPGESGPILFTMGYYRRPRIAEATEAAVQWVARNSWNVSFLLIGLVGLFLAYLQLK